MPHDDDIQVRQLLISVAGEHCPRGTETTWILTRRRPESLHYLNEYRTRYTAYVTKCSRRRPRRKTDSSRFSRAILREINNDYTRFTPVKRNTHAASWRLARQHVTSSRSRVVVVVNVNTRVYHYYCY